MAARCYRWRVMGMLMLWAICGAAGSCVMDKLDVGGTNPFGEAVFVYHAAWMETVSQPYALRH